MCKSQVPAIGYRGFKKKKSHGDLQRWSGDRHGKWRKQMRDLLFKLAKEAERARSQERLLKTERMAKGEGVLEKWRVAWPLRRSLSWNQPWVSQVSLFNVNPVFLIKTIILFVMSKLFFLKLLWEGGKIPQLLLSLPLAGTVATQCSQLLFPCCWLAFLRVDIHLLPR